MQEYQPGKWVLSNRLLHQLEVFQQGHRIQIIPLPAGLALRGLDSLEGKPLVLTFSGVYTLAGNVLHLYHPVETGGPDTLMSVFRDSGNQLWCTDSHDVLWNGIQGKWINLSRKYHTREMPMVHYFEDRDQNVIVQSVYAITVYRRSIYTEIPIADMDKLNAVYVVSMYGKDTLCYGISRQGLELVYQGQHMTLPIDQSVVTPYQGMLNCHLSPTGKPGELLMYIRRKGLYYLQNRTLRLFSRDTTGFSGLYLSSVYDSSHHCFYAGVADKVIRISEQKRDTIDFSSISKGVHSIADGYAFLPDSSLLFVASHTNLIRYHDGKLEDITAQIQTYGKDFYTQYHHGELWVVVHGTEIQIYTYTHGRFHLRRRITPGDGLLDANMNTFVFDQHDNVWMNCFTGLYFMTYKQNEPYVFTRKIPLHLGEQDAPSLDMLLFSDQHVYAIGVGGIFDIQTDKPLFEARPAATYFSSIRILDRDYQQWLEQGQIKKSANGLELPYRFNNLSFTLHSVYYGYDEALQYRYFLQGQDKNWHALHQENSIHFINLNPGAYTLYVRSESPLDPAHFTQAAFAFEIVPPYWKTMPFRIGMALLAVGLLVLLIRYRDKQRNRENKLAIQLSELRLEALQSQMNPHFIFNALNSIQNYILQNEQIEAARYLSKFSKLIRKTLDDSNKTGVPLEEIVESLRMYVELEAFRFNQEFRYEIDMDERDPLLYTIELPPMLLQPYVENAILHGLMPKQGEKILQIHLFIRGHEVYCVIDDNGVGRQAQPKREYHISRGEKLTAGMLESLRQLHWSEPVITITDKKDEAGNAAGTRIEIRIPFKQ